MESSSKHTRLFLSFTVLIKSHLAVSGMGNESFCDSRSSMLEKFGIDGGREIRD